MTTTLQRHLLELLRPMTAKKSDLFLEASLNHIGETASSLRYLGTGANAYVYWMSDKKKIFKMTTDARDAEADALIKSKPDKSLLKVYDVFTISPDRYVYGVVAEHLTPLAGSALKMIERLSYMFYGSDITDKAEVAKRVEQAKENNFTLFDKDLAQLALFSKALADRHIIWGYDFHEDNVMMRGRTLVISDFGGGNSPKQSIPELQVSEL